MKGDNAGDNILVFVAIIVFIFSIFNLSSTRASISSSLLTPIILSIESISALAFEALNKHNS